MPKIYVIATAESTDALRDRLSQWPQSPVCGMMRDPDNGYVVAWSHVAARGDGMHWEQPRTCPHCGAGWGVSA